MRKLGLLKSTTSNTQNVGFFNEIHDKRHLYDYQTATILIVVMRNNRLRPIYISITRLIICCS